MAEQRARPISDLLPSAPSLALSPPFVILFLGSPAWSAPAKQQTPASGLMLLLLLPLFLMLFLALELVLWVVTPAPLAATRNAIERGRGRCLAVGLISGLLAFLLLAGAGHMSSAAKTIAPLLLGIISLGLLAGLSAVVELLGEGVMHLAGRESSRALSVIIGSPLLGLVVLVPIVGQVLGIYFLLVGLGGVIFALIDGARRRK